jgi:subtilisin-like proprotein convertase family protein
MTADIRAALALDPSDPVRTLFASAGLTPILDDAVSASTIHVTNSNPILAVDVGVRLDHPRVSDLALTLVSPSGTRVLLDENRGGADPNGMGLDVILTNTVLASSGDEPATSTKIISTASASGNLVIHYDFYNEADTLRVYCGTNLNPTNRIFDSGALTNSGNLNVAFSANDSHFLTIIIDEGRPLTAWDYHGTLTSPAILYTTFTENTNLTVTPVKFAPPPFTNVTLNPVTLAGSTGIYYLPEESLDKLAGEPALGDWTLEIEDRRAGATEPPPSLVSWQLAFLFKDVMPWAHPLTPAAGQTNTVAPGRIQYYSVNVPPWARFATNQLYAASAPVNLLFNQALLPTGTNVAPPDFSLLSGTTAGSSILAKTGGSPALAPGLTYLLGVQNTDTTAVTFALAVRFDITPLVNDVPAAIDIAVGPSPRYFSFEVSTNATAAAFHLLNLSGDANLVLRKGLPLPTLAGFDYGSFCSGTNSEQIILFTNSAPVPLSPGRWHLGVFNAGLTNITCTILAIEYTNNFPNIITLTSGVAYPNVNSGAGDATDYYHYVVTPAALRAQFEIDGPTGDMTLVARKGLPLPTLTDYTCVSMNPGLNDELITLFDFSKPVPLTPGDWFISAVNVSCGSAAYTIKATEFAAYGTNVVITNCQVGDDGICLTWTSVAGLRYYVQGKTDMNNTNWAAVSPTITAADVMTTSCISLPSPYHFFRVTEGLVVTPYVPPVRITGITSDTNGVRLQWLAPTNSQFQAQWTPSLAPPAWIPFTNILTSTNGGFSFLDDGSQSGGLTGARCYRLQQLP